MVYYTKFQMSKFNLIVLLYLIILLNIHCVGKPIRVSLKIKDNWEEKREFIYLKDVELKERFVVKTIEKHNNHYFGSNYNMEGFTSLVDLDLASNIFKNIELNVSRLDTNYLLKMKIVIEIANNKFIRNFVTGFEKRVIFIYLYYIACESSNITSNSMISSLYPPIYPLPKFFIGTKNI